MMILTWFLVSQRWSYLVVRNGKKGPNQDTGLGNRGRLKVLTYTKLQRKHQNFNPSILSWKFGLIFMRIKQNFFFFFEKKIPKWPFFKKGHFSKSPILKIFSWKFRRFVKISSRYMVMRLSDISSKTAKKHKKSIFSLF